MMEGERGEQSSTSSHYSEVHETATAGVAADDFMGIELNNDLSKAPFWQCMVLLGLIFFLSRKPRVVQREFAIVFWASVLGICVLVKEVTLIPLLTTMVYTRTSYPYLVVLPHCIYSQISYRKAYGDSANRLHALLVGFLLYGFGGSIVSDMCMGLPVTALAHPRILPCHVAGWLVVWYSPYDAIYRAFQQQGGLVRAAIMACEAVDAVTTPMGRIARSARELRNKETAPLVAGVLAGIGGGGLRHILAGAPFSDLETGFYKTMGYSLLFWATVVYRCEHGVWMEDPDRNHCYAYNGSDILRVTFVLGHVLWTLSSDAGLVSGHPFVWISKRLKDELIPVLTQRISLGPTATTKLDDNRKKDL